MTAQQAKDAAHIPLTQQGPRDKITAAEVRASVDVAIDFAALPDATKVDKVEGKGLSSNDYTNPEKQKLAGLTAGEDGAPGLSAYEVAVANGFVGTEAEWLESLKGDNGVSGSLQSSMDKRSVDLIAYFGLTAKDFNHLKSGELKEVVVANAYMVRSVVPRFAWDDNQDLLIQMGSNGLRNNPDVVNIDWHGLAPIGTSSYYQNIYLNYVPGGSNDDASPVPVEFANGVSALSGGNHGWPCSYLTQDGHPFVYNDCGSVGVDAAGMEVVLMTIQDGNSVGVIANADTVNGKWVVPNISAAVSPIIFQTPTGPKTLSFTSKANSEMYGFVHYDQSVAYLVDGTAINRDADATYSNPTDFKILEKYSSINPFSLPAIWAADRPAGGYTDNPSRAVGEKLFTFRNLFDAGPRGKWTQYWSVEMHTDKFSLVRYAVTQKALGDDAAVSSYRRYIPNLLPITDGATQFDYRTGEDVRAHPFTSFLNITPAGGQGGRLTERSFEKIEGSRNGTDFAYNYNVAYLPQYRSFDKRLNDFMWLFYASGSKLYPMELSRPNLPAGTYSGVVVRGPEIVPETAGVLNSIRFHAYGSEHQFMDFDAAGSYTLPTLDGHRVELLEISGNASLVGNTITVSSVGNVAALDDAYAYVAVRYVPTKLLIEPAPTTAQILQLIQNTLDNGSIYRYYKKFQGADGTDITDVDPNFTYITGAGDLLIQGNQLDITTADASVGSMVINQSVTYDDAEMEIVLTLNPGTYANVLLRTQDADNFWLLEIYAPLGSGTRFGLHKKVNGGFQTIGAFPTGVPYGSESTVYISLTGSMLNFRVDDSPVQTWNIGADFPTGGFGIGGSRDAYGDSTNAIGRIKSFKIL